MDDATLQRTLREKIADTNRAFPPTSAPSQSIERVRGFDFSNTKEYFNLTDYKLDTIPELVELHCVRRFLLPHGRSFCHLAPMDAFWNLVQIELLARPTDNRPRLDSLLPLLEIEIDKAQHARESAKDGFRQRMEERLAKMELEKQLRAALTRIEELQLELAQLRGMT